MSAKSAAEAAKAGPRHAIRDGDGYAGAHVPPLGCMDPSFHHSQANAVAARQLLSSISAFDVRPYVRLDCRSFDGKADPKMALSSYSNPMMERPFGADSGEKHGLAGDIDTAAVVSLKALERPIRELTSTAPNTAAVDLADAETLI